MASVQTPHQSHLDLLPPERLQGLGQVGSDKVVQADRVDDLHRPVGIVDRKGELGPLGTHHAMGLEQADMLILVFIVQRVAVLDMDQGQVLWRLGVGPGHHLGNRSFGGTLAHEPPGLIVADMEEVGQGIESAQRLDKIILQALCDQDGIRHRGTLVYALYRRRQVLKPK